MLRFGLRVVKLAERGIFWFQGDHWGLSQVRMYLRGLLMNFIQFGSLPRCVRGIYVVLNHLEFVQDGYKVKNTC